MPTTVAAPAAAGAPGVAVVAAAGNGAKGCPEEEPEVRPPNSFRDEAVPLRSAS